MRWMKINKDVNYAFFSKTMSKTNHFKRERERGVIFIEWANGVRKTLYYSKLKYYIIDLKKLVSEINIKKFMSIFQDDPTQ